MQRSFSSGSGDPRASLARREAARCAAVEIVRRWDSGEVVTEAQAAAEHPDLAPELVEELRSVRSIHSAHLAARRAGEITQPIRIMSADELEAPIEIPDDPSHDVPENLPIRISGYRLLELIRQGGQAIVYKGIQEATGRTVAIKIMKGGSAALSRHRTRFDREVQILARLDQQNIVSVIDRGRTADGAFFLAMEFVEGPELDEYCRDHVARNENPSRELLRLFVKIARAVGVAHSYGIVHRDLKPSNIRIDKHGEPKLLDFGLARLVEEEPDARTVTVSGQIIGSIPWASPEQAAGSMEVGAQSDVYSLGVNFYQMLTGQFPYPVEGPLHEALSNIACAIPQPPSAVAHARRVKHQGILDAIILKALTKDPRRRYASASELANDLECALEGRRGSVTPLRRRRLRWAMVAGFAAVCLGAACWLATRPTPPAVIPFPSVGNSVGMRLVLLPSGKTLIGGPTMTNSYVVVKKDVGPFFLSTTEVTQRQFAGVMGSNPSDPRWIGADLPVQMVTWDEARSFCDRLSAREANEHHHYRLPTRAEWQYAARAGIDGDYKAGDLKRFAWYGGSNGGNSAGRLRPVAQLWPNRFGVYDMLGGVGEWIADQQAGSFRTVCGGSFLRSQEECRLAASHYVEGDIPRPDIGFRVVLSVDSK